MAQNVKLIFDVAVEIDDAEKRARYLDNACGTDVDLRQRVESLLNAVNSCGEFLQQRAADSFEIYSDPADRIGRTIGRYNLLEKIGAGGFGYVYMAEQHSPVSRRVALKIIKPGMDSSQVVARFEAERQALALMEHPNIGKFLDAGATDTGRPYFVMELVRGIPVTDYCQAHRLSTTERLELFTEICGAVEHAHQKGIIHRDIKPTNILVYNNGDRPVPKVIDFGIAKATQGQLTDKTLFTQFHQFIGTPAYMSPEQAQMSGLDIDTRSDIYSLGVLLYELLTGRTPLDSKDLQQQGYEETCRRIRDQEAPTPSKRIGALGHDELNTLADSHRTAPTNVVSRLRGDLDWIVMKALEKDRTRRYKTTDALATDIRRHLNHEPVTAGPPSAAYILRKFLRRNRRAALTTSAFAALFVLGAVISIVGWARAVATKKELNAQIFTTREALAESNESRKQARRTAYLADIQAAHQALELNDLGLARKLLEQTRNLDPQFEFRNWEWQALWVRCQGNAESWFGGDPSVNSLSVHPDGKLVAAGCHDVVRIWDIFAGKIVHEVEVAGLGKARFSPSGDLLYTIDLSGAARALRIPSFEPTDFLLSHRVPYHWEMELQVSPDGALLATFSGRYGKEVAIWDTRTQELRARIPIRGWNCPLAFSPDGASLFLGDRELDLASMDTTRILDRSWPRKSVSFSPDGKHIASSTDLHGFRIQRVSDGHEVTRMEKHGQPVYDVVYSPDGKLIASASLDRTVMLWDTRSQRVVAELREHDLGVVGLAFLPDGQRLLSTGRDGKICLWNVAEVQRTEWPITIDGLYDWTQVHQSIPQVSCSPSGAVLLTTHTKLKDVPGVTLLSTNDLRKVRTIAESSGVVRSVLCSPVEDLLVVANQEGALEFFKTDGTRRGAPIAHAENEAVFPARFTPDGKRLLAIIRAVDRRKRVVESRCAVYSVSDQTLIASWSVPGERCAAISPNGELVVTGHDDGLRFWPVTDPQTPAHVRVGGQRAGETGGVISSVDFSPDGACVAAGGNLTGRIEIVDAQTKSPAGHLAGHLQHIKAVRFSPDGKRLASGGHTFSDALKIWDIASRREIMSLSVEGAWSAGQVEWLPDGNSIMLLTGDSIISLWRVPSFEDIQECERQQTLRNSLSGLRPRN